MNCPTDNSVLVMSERNGIEIDYCPQCRGVWLDRGELDKIIERAAVPAAPAHQQQPPQDWRQQQDYGNQRGYPPRKKRENWLSELFD